MKEDLFRKKSIDKIQSPESLNDYVKIANPGIWVVLAAIVLLLIGAGVWTIFGSIETKVEGDANVKNENVVCTIESEKISRIEKDMVIRIQKFEGKIQTIDLENKQVTAKIEGLKDGEYKASIVLESIKPIKFIFN